MQRLGIFTYFYNYNNAGTLVQAHCLSKHLLSQGFPNEVVRHFYMPRFKVLNADESDVRCRSYRRFITHSVPWSTESFTGDDLSETAEFVNQRYDAIIVGSDEVWKFKPRRSATAYQIPVPNLYWPDRKFRIPTIAYAATIGSSNPSHLGWRRRGQLAKSLSSFSLISVRDRVTQRFVKKLTGNAVELLPDPTFAVDPIAAVDVDRISALMNDARDGDDRPLVVVACESSESPKVAATFAELEMPDAQLVAPHAGFPGAKILPQPISPTEWFAVLGLADFVITTRMHGVVACLRGNTPCRIVDSRPKIRELAEDFGLPSIVFGGGNANAIADAWPHLRIKEKIDAARLRHQAFVARLHDTVQRAAA